MYQNIKQFQADRGISDDELRIMAVIRQKGSHVSGMSFFFLEATKRELMRISEIKKIEPDELLIVRYSRYRKCAVWKMQVPEDVANMLKEIQL